MSSFQKPIILDPQKSSDKKQIEKLLSETQSDFIIDSIDLQLEELYFIRHPSKKTGDDNKQEIQKFISTFFSDKEKYLFGSWVFYEWNNYFVHFLPEDLHTELRTARNRNLITKAEQDSYYNARIGIAGLSVGNSAMATILYTGGAKYLKLADPDILSGSNINRIRTGFQSIGSKKVHVAACEIYGVNPYAELILYENGLDLSNLEEFLINPSPLSVLIEEMDNLYLKIQIRLLARKHRIPVIMAADNGDNIVLDVERYDLYPNRPILHGDVPEEELLKINADLPKHEAGRIISRWVHPENVSVRMQESLLELGKSLFSWPQLGNAAFLAGCALSYCARKIILREKLLQGKFLISLDEKLIPEYFTKSEVKKRADKTNSFKQILGLP